MFHYSFIFVLSLSNKKLYKLKSSMFIGIKIPFMNIFSHLKSTKINFNVFLKRTRILSFYEYFRFYMIAFRFHFLSIFKLIFYFYVCFHTIIACSSWYKAMLYFTFKQKFLMNIPFACYIGSYQSRKLLFQ